MSEKIYCPVCKHEVNYMYDGTYHCFDCKIDFLDKKVIEQLGDAILINLGKVKKIGKTFFIINKSNGNFGIIIEKTLGYFENHGLYKFDEIKINVSSSKETLYKTNGITPMIVGGILFGSAGAIAGSIVGTNSKTVKERNVYSITISINSLDFSGLVVETSDANLVHDFVTKIEIIRKNLAENISNSNEKPVVNNKENNDASIDVDIFEMLTKLKKLYDDGVIDLATYQEKKKKYVDML